MGNKLTGVLTTGLNLVIVVLDENTNWYNTDSTSFESYSVGNVSKYAITGSEIGNTAIYSFTVPTVKAGKYQAYMLNQTGTNLGEGDFPPIGQSNINWDGTGIVNLTPEEKNDVGTALLDLAGTIDTKTVRQTLRYLGAVIAGKIPSGAGTSTETFKGLDGSTDRITITVDNDGNRTNISYDP